MKVYILSVLLLICLFYNNHFFAFSYYEVNFSCSFNNFNLIITQTSHSGGRNCLDLIAHLKSKKSEITKLIELAKGDSDYNKSAKLQLIKQRSEIDLLYNRAIQGVTDLEGKLFNSYKKKYFSKIKPIRSKLIAKQAVLSADLLISIREGEKTLVGKITKTIGFNYQRIKLIEGILTSKSLDEMMPLLQTYESIIMQYVEGKSE